jgi:anti-anti-sigma regulatory factor/HAMP domain-containing protein
MLFNLTIRTKLLVILSAVAIFSAGISSYMGYQTARRALEEQSFKGLTAVREMKATHVEDYFQNIVDQIVTFSEDRMAIDAAKAFRSAFRDLRSDLGLDRQALENDDLQLRLSYQNEFLRRLNANLPVEASLSDYWPDDDDTRALQYLYIASNPFETGSKHLLDAASDRSTYSRVHGLYHPIIRSFLERFGYYDIFLVDHETGHIIYSVFKEVDFGTSLMSGPYRDTNFGRAFRAARDGESKDFVRLEDFKPYHPSYNAEASFIASPIFDDKDMVGVLVFQMPVDRINDIMTSQQEWANVGLGQTGETYIVADDYTIRNQSRFLIEDRENYLRAIEKAGAPKSTLEMIANLGSSIGRQEVKTEGTRAALVGESGTRIFPDYRGVPVLSSFKPLEIRDVHWAIMSEIDVEEAFQPVTALRNRTLMWLLMLFVVILVVAVVFSKGLTRPLKDLSRTAANLAKGKMDTPIDVRGQDEIADLSRSFDVMRRSLQGLLHRQEQAIDALSVPMIPLQDDIVVMPLVGELDARRVERFRAALVEGLHDSGARVAIIDITGVPAMDEQVAAGLIRAAQSARLLGAQVVMTGMQPETAQSLVDFDLHFEGLATARSLQHGIDLAMQHIKDGAGMDSDRASEEE